MRPYPPQPARALNIGRVLSLTIAVVARAWLPIGLIALVLEWAPNAAQALVFDAFGKSLNATPYAASGVTSAFWLVFPFADMAVVVAALAVLGGRRPRLGETLAVAARLYPVALGLDVLQNLTSLAEAWLIRGPQDDTAQFVTGLIDIVYALASAAILLPSLGAAAQDRLGFSAALVRTAAVSHGARLRIAALAAIFLIAQRVIEPLLQAVMLDLLGRSPAVVFISFAPHGLFFAIASASQAILYWELARLRDGAAPGEVEALFS